jgi:hypothetical protein
MVPPGSNDSSPGESQEPRKRPLTACLPPTRSMTVPDTLSDRRISFIPKGFFDVVPAFAGGVSKTNLISNSPFFPGGGDGRLYVGWLDLQLAL